MILMKRNTTWIVSVKADGAKGRGVAMGLYHHEREVGAGGAVVALCAYFMHALSTVPDKEPIANARALSLPGVPNSAP